MSKSKTGSGKSKDMGSKTAVKDHAKKETGKKGKDVKGSYR